MGPCAPFFMPKLKKSIHNLGTISTLILLAKNNKHSLSVIYIFSPIFVIIYYRNSIDMINYLKIWIGISAFSLALYSCNKKDNETGNIIVKMQDAPINADSVNVEIIGIQLQSPGNGWISLPVQAGRYNLLELQNGIDTTVALGAPIPAGKINQMRLILGQNNNIVVDSVSHPLLLSSQDETGLKLNLNYDFQPGIDYVIKYDFVVDESIIEQGNGSYRLKPVLKTVYIQAL